MTRSPVCASYQPTRTGCKLSVVLNLYRALAAVQGAGAKQSSTSLFLSLPSHFILQGQGFKRNRALRLWIPACVQVMWKQNRQYAPRLLMDFLQPKCYKPFFTPGLLNVTLSPQSIRLALQSQIWFYSNAAFLKETLWIHPSHSFILHLSAVVGLIGAATKLDYERTVSESKSRG